MIPVDHFTPSPAHGEIRYIEEFLALPPQCPGCGGQWRQTRQSEVVCGRCGLTGAEVAGLLRAGCAAYGQARQAALEGRYSEALEYLSGARQSGIAALSEHPAVETLERLCRLALGSLQALQQTVLAEEQAARYTAARGDFKQASLHASRAAGLAPGALPLQKLLLLTLYGAGRMEAAARLRQQLRQAAPADPDLLRWRWKELDQWDRYLAETQEEEGAAWRRGRTTERLAKVGGLALLTTAVLVAALSGVRQRHGQT